MKILDELEAVHADATPGPWNSEARDISSPDAFIADCLLSYDARAIARAHNALPALILVARLAAEVDRTVQDDGVPIQDYIKARNALRAALDALSQVKP